MECSAAVAVVAAVVASDASVVAAVAAGYQDKYLYQTGRQEEEEVIALVVADLCLSDCP